MLKEKLLEDFKSAMRDKNEIRKNTLTLIRSSILQVEKDKQIELTDEQIIEIISKEAKKRKDSLVEFEKSGREDLITQTKQEMEIVKEYLPEEISEEKLTEIIKEVIVETEAKDMKDMGKVMKLTKERVGVTADGKTINEIVKKLLQN